MVFVCVPSYGLVLRPLKDIVIKRMYDLVVYVKFSREVMFLQLCYNCFRLCSMRMHLQSGLNATKLASKQ